MARLVIAVGLCACGAEMDEPLDAGAVDAPAVDASPIDSSPSPIDAPVGDAGPDASEPPALAPPWRREPSYPLPVDHHATAIVESASGPFVYVFGGMHADVSGHPIAIHDAVHRAPIGADGTLGAWEAEGPLPAPLAFHVVATSGDMIVLAGGASTHDDGSLGWIPFVMWTTVAGDGHLGPWGGVEALDAPTLHGAAAIVGDRLYVVGGGGGAGSSSTAVRSLRIGADGLDDARSETALPGERSHHALVVHDGSLYVAGGFAGPPSPATSVLRSRVEADGSLAPWEEVGSIAEPPWTASAVVSSSAIVLIGGGAGAGPTDRVVRLPLDAEVLVGEPELLAALPYPRAHVHQTPALGERVYSIGGRYAEGLGQASSTDVYSATIAELVAAR